MFDIEKVVRENIKQLTPYKALRSDYPEDVRVFLDANENAFGSPLLKWYNRYPNPMQTKLKAAIAKVKSVEIEKIFLGNGTDECIDILIRCFCEPGKDNMIICPPNYDRYDYCATLNNVEIKKAPLLDDFQLDLVHLENLVDANTKIIWITSPNNPTGNSMAGKMLSLFLIILMGLLLLMKPT